MPIPLPDLDDRRYADLVAQARALIPSLAPAWTDHNPSDPGITFMELLAWLTEMLLFQVNQVPPASVVNFLKLINGPDWVMPDGASMDDAIRQTMAGSRTRYRAVTAGDFEWLALNTWPGTAAAAAAPGGGALARAYCVPRRNLSAADPAVLDADAPAHVSLVVLPSVPLAPDDATALYQALWGFLDERRTLTTRHHVVGPGYVPVVVSANLALRADAPPRQALTDAQDALAARYDPLTGGPDGTGWPFGRAVYAADAAAVLEALPLVDYVEDVQVGVLDAGDVVLADGGVPLAANELVLLQPAQLAAYDETGQRYVPGQVLP